MRAKVVDMQTAKEILRERGLTITMDEGSYRQCRFITPYENTPVGPRMNSTELRKAATLILAAGLR